jgi:hypothetical protein
MVSTTSALTLTIYTSGSGSRVRGDDAARPASGRMRRSLTPPCAGRTAAKQLRDLRVVRGEIGNRQSRLFGSRCGGRVLTPLLRTRQHSQAPPVSAVGHRPLAAPAPGHQPPHQIAPLAASKLGQFPDPRTLAAMGSATLLVDQCSPLTSVGMGIRHSQVSC